MNITHWVQVNSLIFHGQKTIFADLNRPNWSGFYLLLKL